MTITEFLLARIAEDEAMWQAMPFGPSFGHAELWQRMLTKCEAERQIVEVARRQIDGITEGRPHHSFLSGRVHDGCAILSALALPYAEHPDYREEWRP